MPLNSRPPQALRAAPLLMTIRLNLRDNSIGLPGVAALARWGPALQTLSLNLERNPLGPAGVAALASLHTSRALSDLSLHLGYNKVGDGPCSVSPGTPCTPPIPNTTCTPGPPGPPGLWLQADRGGYTPGL